VSCTAANGRAVEKGVTVSKRRRPREGADASAEKKRQKARDVFVPRPFAGLADEGDWVAMRELVPAASAPLQLAPDLAERHGDRSVTLATVLPMAWPAMTKPDGRILVGLQRHAHSGDASRDLAAALLAALDTAPGEDVAVPALPGEGPRLQDVLADGALEVTVHDGFDFWLDPGAADDPSVQASLERANASVVPTVRLSAVRSGYWCRVPDRCHVRWVLADDEEPALAALARLAAAGELALGEGTRFAGMFRACGLLIPVWDLPAEPPAAEWEAPMQDFAKRYAEAIGNDAELTSAERRARQGLVGRQLTLR
jgi:hypothetical protein